MKRAPSCCSAIRCPSGPCGTKKMELTLMTTSVPAKARILSARRLVLLASVAGLGVAVLGGADLVTKASGPALSTVAYAQGVQRPMGFADIVAKVKPAVISVRVKLDAGPKMMGMEGDSSAPTCRTWRPMSSAVSAIRLIRGPRVTVL